MIQLLSATISSPNNLLFCNLFKFVERLADICRLPFASLLANACLDSIGDVSIFLVLLLFLFLKFLFNIFLMLSFFYILICGFLIISLGYRLCYTVV